MNWKDKTRVYLSRLILSLYFCLIFLPGILDGQTKPKPYILHWTEKDGLCNNLVFQVIQDQEGNLWIGTANGLCRFDGTSFTSFQYDPKDQGSISSNEAVFLMEAQDHRIWIGTDGGGLSVYDQGSESFTTFRQNLKDPQSGLMEDRVYNIWEESDGEMVIGYRAIGSGQGGLSILSPDFKIKQHVLQDRRDYANFPLKITQILQDPDQNNSFWLAGRSFFWWDKASGDFAEFPHPGFRPNYTSIHGIMNDSDSSLLVALNYDGLWQFDKKNKKWAAQIHPLAVQSICKDQENNIWLADPKGIGWFDEKRTQVNYELLLNNPQSPFPASLLPSMRSRNCTPVRQARQPARCSANRRPRRPVANVQSEAREEEG